MSETVFIENYRGKDIFYSTRNEKFFADIDEGKEKNLIHLIRKDVDDYIKANQNFKPFVAFDYKSFESIFGNVKKKTITGIRKDKALQCADNTQISNNDLDDSRSYSPCTWYILNEDVEKHCMKSIKEEQELISILEKEIKTHKLKIEGFVDQMKGENLADFRRRILGEIKEQIQ